MESEFLNNLSFWLTSAQLQEQLIGIKILFILFGILFLVGIFYLLFKSTFLKVHFWQDWTEFISFKSYGLEKIHRRLERVRRKTESNLESDRKMAVLEGEDLLNEVLKRNGFYEMSLKESLEKMGKEIVPNAEEILSVHKIYRNMTVDPDYHLTLPEAKKFLGIIEEIFKNLGVI